MSTRTRVLVVDDDASIRDLVDMALSDDGYEVISAEHGAAALVLVGRAKPDVILLDMRMPVMSGWAFAQAYQQQPGPHVPIIVLAAARDVAAWAAEIKAAGYLRKPFALADLYACVNQHVSVR